MSAKRWRLANPPQPMVFCFSGVTALCGAVRRLYGLDAVRPSSLSLYRGRYYLAVFCGLRERRPVTEAAGEFGACLGPARVLYAFYAEHGRELSRDAVAQLGAALNGRQ